MPVNRISHITLYVHDQDEALEWYRDRLGFQVCIDDSDYRPNFRWLTICPAGNIYTQMVLMPATTDAEKTRVGTNALTVLSTGDCRSDEAALEAAGVEIVDPPAELPWGISAMIRDLYGNPYNLLSPI